MKQNGEFIRDKDYINKVITETIMPVLMEEVNCLAPSGAISSNSGGDKALLDIINNQLVPLIKKSHSGEKGKLKLTNYDALLNKLVDLLEELERRSLKALGLEDMLTNEDENSPKRHIPIPDLIDKRLTEINVELAVVKKDTKKSKRLEDKMATENVKFKSDIKTLKDEVKRLKDDLKLHKTELKKGKDELKKSKLENEKLKVETKNLKEHLERAGIDLRISSDFMQASGEG